MEEETEGFQEVVVKHKQGMTEVISRISQEVTVPGTEAEVIVVIHHVAEEEIMAGEAIRPKKRDIKIMAIVHLVQTSVTSVVR